MAHDIIFAIRDILVAIAIGYFRVHMGHIKRDNQALRKELKELREELSAGVHSRSAAAGADDDMDRADSRGRVRGNGGLPDRKR